MGTLGPHGWNVRAIDFTENFVKVRSDSLSKASLMAERLLSRLRSWSGGSSTAQLYFLPN